MTYYNPPLGIIRLFVNPLLMSILWFLSHNLATTSLLVVYKNSILGLYTPCSFFFQKGRIHLSRGHSDRLPADCRDLQILTSLAPPHLASHPPPTHPPESKARPPRSPPGSLRSTHAARSCGGSRGSSPRRERASSRRCPRSWPGSPAQHGGRAGRGWRAEGGGRRVGGGRAGGVRSVGRSTIPISWQDHSKSLLKASTERHGNSSTKHLSPHASLRIKKEATLLQPSNTHRISAKTLAHLQPLSDAHSLAPAFFSASFFRSLLLLFSSYTANSSAQVGFSGGFSGVKTAPLKGE